MTTPSASPPASSLQSALSKLSWGLVLASISVGSIAPADTAIASPPITQQNSTDLAQVTEQNPAQDPTPNPVPSQETTIQTGDVQVTLRWESEDDLDLYVRDPSGEVVSFFNPEIASGGRLDVDANSGCQAPSQTPLENIFWPAGSGVPGDYMVTIELFSDCGSGAPANFTLEVLTYGDVQTHTGTVSYKQESAHIPFSLPDTPAE